MRVSDLVKTASSSLIRNTSRSLLTILGIVIGISSVILMLSIGQSAEGLILNQVADLGSDLVFVEPSSGDPVAGPPDIFMEQSLNLDDAKALRESGLFSAVDATIFQTVAVSSGDDSIFTQLSGVTESYLDIYPADLKYGRFFEKSDIDSNARVAVLGVDIASDFFGDQNPVGERIKVKNISLRVIGVLDEQGSRFFQNLDQQISVPVTMLQRDIVGDDYVNFITGHASGDVEFAKEETRFILRDEHDIYNPFNNTDKDNFYVSSQSDAQEMIGVVGDILSILLGSIAAISLVVGGIGIMNIMLVSVTERTKEIGLRKSIGATYSEILQQFLLEAVLLTSIGGILGVILGAVASLVTGTIAGHYVDGWGADIPLTAAIMGLVVSTTVGLVFGIYPAKSAAKLEPIEALRYE